MTGVVFDDSFIPGFVKDINVMRIFIFPPQIQAEFVNDVNDFGNNDQKDLDSLLEKMSTAKKRKTLTHHKALEVVNV